MKKTLVGGCRLKISYTDPDIYNPVTDDGRFYLYDVGPEELERILEKYKDVKIEEWGKFIHNESELEAHTYKKEIKRIKELMKKYASV